MFVIQMFSGKKFMCINHDIEQHDHERLRNRFIKDLSEATAFHSQSEALDAAADYGQRHEYLRPGSDVPCLVLLRIAEDSRRIVETL